MVSSMDRYTAKFNAEQKILDDRISVKLNVTASHTRNDSPPSGNTNATGELFSHTLNANPTYPTHNEDGTLFQFPD